MSDAEQQLARLRQVWDQVTELPDDQGRALVRCRRGQRECQVDLGNAAEVEAACRRPRTWFSRLLPWVLVGLVAAMGWVWMSLFLSLATNWNGQCFLMACSSARFSQTGYLALLGLRVVLLTATLLLWHRRRGLAWLCLGLVGVVLPLAEAARLFS